MSLESLEQAIKDLKSIPRKFVGDAQVTVSSSAVGLTVPSVARRAVIQVTGADIYFTEDGGTPSSSKGREATLDDILEYLDADYRTVLLDFRAIRQSADAILKCVFYD